MDERCLFETATSYQAFSGPKTVIRVYKNRIVFWGAPSAGDLFQNNNYITILFKNIYHIKYHERNNTLIGMLIPFFAPKPTSWLYITTNKGENYITVEHLAQAEVRSAYSLLMDLL